MLRHGSPVVTAAVLVPERIAVLRRRMRIARNLDHSFHCERGNGSARRSADQGGDYGTDNSAARGWFVQSHEVLALLPGLAASSSMTPN